MKKIPNLFERDWQGDKSRVLPKLHEGADVEWVLRGEGTPTIKWDGSAVRVKNGVLTVRYDAKPGKTPPDGFEPCDEVDPKTGHRPGWIPPDPQQHKWHIVAFDNSGALADGTYEALGPQHQTNPYKLPKNILRRHGIDLLHLPSGWVDAAAAHDFLQTFLRSYLMMGTARMLGFDEIGETLPIEGIVWYHQDGRMVKVLAADLGIPWKVKSR